MATTKKPTKKSDSKSTTKQAPAPIKKGGKKAMVERTPVTTYVPVSHHIYYDGRSYRVRASVNGTRYSQSFPSKKKAFAFRKSILSVG
jgi:hypothetical protein